jgi:hypothetical protein
MESPIIIIGKKDVNKNQSQAKRLVLVFNRRKFDESIKQTAGSSLFPEISLLLNPP